MEIKNWIIAHMEIRDWITICSVIAVIGGWFANSHYNRKNEIAKKLLDLRLPTLNSILDFREFIIASNNKPDGVEFVKRVNKIGMSFQLYGQNDEIKLFDKFVKNSYAHDEKEALDTLNKLITLVIDRIREELNIDAIEK